MLLDSLEIFGEEEGKGGKGGPEGSGRCELYKIKAPQIRRRDDCHLWTECYRIKQALYVKWCYTMREPSDRIDDTYIYGGICSRNEGFSLLWGNMHSLVWGRIYSLAT